MNERQEKAYSEIKNFIRGCTVEAAMAWTMVLCNRYDQYAGRVTKQMSVGELLRAEQNERDDLNRT